MSITIKQVGAEYHIRFAYNPLLVESVKRIPGKRWDKPTLTWIVPLASAIQVAQFAQRHGVRFDAPTNFTVPPPDPDPVPETYVIPPMPELTVHIPLKRKLFPYQETGVAYALEKKRLIIGDEPGLGKTGQAIAAISAAGAFPCLIICPSSLKLNWKREVEIWTGHRAMLMQPNVKSNWQKYYEAGMAQFFVVNYESLKKYFVTEIRKSEAQKLTLKNVVFDPRIDLFKSVVIDESHRVKSSATQQTKFTKGIASGKEYILALTGTPVVNKPKDLMSQLGIIDRLMDFGGYKKFIDRYCAGEKEASNLKELNYRLLTSCFYRREKTAVLKDLPAKMRQVMLCDIDNRDEYRAADTDLESYLKQYCNASDEQVARSLRGEIMVRIGKLKNISARGKLSQVFEFIEDTLDSGNKLVVFGHLKDVIGRIKERFPGCVSITGDDDTTSRQAAVDRFQGDPKCRLIVCSIQAAGVGITLTAASRVAFVEMGWHPAIMDQCEDRCHRIGQTDSVQCTYFLGKDTIDENIYKLIDDKREMSSAITGATNDVEVRFQDMLLGSLFNEKKIPTPTYESVDE
ncbi:MAG TPA: DEAD/DEAH box helicase [Chitinophagales bacterium]|nr:DEAD/DEAH box helicase [Chitinophagales bacterium]